MANNDVLAEIYLAAANEIENSEFNHWQAGPRLWGIIGRVLYDLYGTPATEGVARRVGVSQAQHWDTDQATAVKTLRELAANHEQMDLLRDTSTEHTIMTARRALAEALDWPPEDHATLMTMARETAHDLARLKQENEKLRTELAAAKRRT